MFFRRDFSHKFIKIKNTEHVQWTVEGVAAKETQVADPDVHGVAGQGGVNGQGWVAFAGKEGKGGKQFAAAAGLDHKFLKLVGEPAVIAGEVGDVDRRGGHQGVEVAAAHVVAGKFVVVGSGDPSSTPYTKR